MSGVSWTAADPEVETVATRTLLFDSSLAEVPPGLVNVDTPIPASPNNPADSINFIHTEATHDNAAPASLSLQNSREKRRGLSPALGSAALIAVACFGLLISHFLKPAGEKKVAEDPHRQQKNEVQAIDTHSLFEQLRELQELQPVAASLAELVNSRESNFVLRNFHKTLERATYIEQEASAGRLSHWSSPEAELKTVLENGISDIYRLFELARLSGLSMEQELQVTPAPPGLPEEQRRVLSQTDFAVTASLALHMRDLDFSCKSYKWHAERAGNGLQTLPNFTGLEDKMLLGVVNSHVEFIKSAHEAVEVGMRAAERLASTADSVMLSKDIRKHMRIYRELRDNLRERRALCDLERWRQASLPPGGTAVLDEQEEIEQLLDKGDGLLQLYAKEIELMQRRRDTLSSAEVTVHQAAAVGDELKGLLDTVSARMRSVETIAEAERIREQKAIKAKASRASEDAAAASKRMTDILTQIESGKLSLTYSPDAMKAHEEGGSLTETMVNSEMVKAVTESLHQLKDNAKATTVQLSHVAAELETAGLEAVAEKATAATEELADKAEMLLLHAEVLESIERDMQLSAALAERAAALARAGTKEFQGESVGTPELPSHKRKQVESLLYQVETAKAIARSQWSLVDLAATAASMKGAALGLASMVTVHHVGSTSPS
ncbi:hypothetical protein, conserved [Eimeria brunetti]|uniref:Uncharacterized protein n=1 Tax=Eimeria brunetti TaxID=51314 RepID=U6LGB4_9EIME|nr:hypothetical protein, conserved [Eimeria brunetti]